jgi:hypothetical protein
LWRVFFKIGSHDLFTQAGFETRSSWLLPFFFIIKFLWWYIHYTGGIGSDNSN